MFMGLIQAGRFGDDRRYRNYLINILDADSRKTISE